MLSKKIMGFAHSEATKFGLDIEYKQTKDKIIFVLKKNGKQGTYCLPANKHKSENFFFDVIKTGVRRVRNELEAA